MKAKTFTEGPILRPLIQFVLSVLAVLFLQNMYDAVDLLMVGQYSCANEVSAVSTGSQLMHSLTVVVNGLSRGITIMIGQYIGQKCPEKAARTIGSGISLFLVVTLIMTIEIIALAEPLARLTPRRKLLTPRWPISAFAAQNKGRLLRL